MSNDVVGPTPAAVLRNRGVPIRLHRLERDAVSERWRRVYTEAGEPEFDEHWVQMTNAVLADLVDPVNGWGSLDSWQKALRADPHEALQHTLALCLDWWKAMPDGVEEPDSRRAGVAMVDAELESYSAAIGAAFMLANGVRPERVGEVLAAGIASAAELRGKMMDRLADTAERMAKESTDRIRRALDEPADAGTTRTSPGGEASTPLTTGSGTGSEPEQGPSTSSGG